MKIYILQKMKFESCAQPFGSCSHAENWVKGGVGGEDLEMSCGGDGRTISCCMRHHALLAWSRSCLLQLCSSVESCHRRKDATLGKESQVALGRGRRYCPDCSSVSAVTTVSPPHSPASSRDGESSPGNMEHEASTTNPSLSCCIYSRPLRTRRNS
jgi:hypothetical protein